MALDRFEFTKTFMANRCNFCGRCFAECPVLRLPLEQARNEIHALIEGAPSPVLDLCTGCMACNSICPRDANPHTLIVSRWHDRYLREGLPYPAGLLLPYQEPNLYTLARRHLPQHEETLVQQWERNWREPPSDVMMYAGCNLLLQPFLVDSPLFKDIPIFGSLDLCCGEPFYRMGCWEAAKAAARNVRESFDRMRLKKVIVPCLAGYHLFKYVYPAVFDVPLDVEVMAIEDWLLDRIRGGKITVTPLNNTAVLHDNCWPKASGEDLFKKVRDLMGAIGVTVIEPPNTKEKALCCGMCAGAARFRLRDIYRVARERLDELEEAGADYVVNYCGGCNWLFGIVNQILLSKYKTPHLHLLELVRMAAGEMPESRTAPLSRAIIRSITPRLAARFIRGGRFRIDAVNGKRVDTGSP